MVKFTRLINTLVFLTMITIKSMIFENVLRLFLCQTHWINKVHTHTKSSTTLAKVYYDAACTLHMFSLNSNNVGLNFIQSTGIYPHNDLIYLIDDPYMQEHDVKTYFFDFDPSLLIDLFSNHLQYNVYSIHSRIGSIVRVYLS